MYRVVNVHDIAVVYNVHRVPLVLLALVMCLVKVVQTGQYQIR